MKLFHPSKKILSCYLDSELKDSKKRRLEVHISTCSRCAKEVNILRTLDLSFKEKKAQLQLPDKSYFESYTSRVMDKLEQRTPPGILERLWTYIVSLTIFDYIPMPTVRALGLAASFIFIITFGFWMIQTQQPFKIKPKKTVPEKKILPHEETPSPERELSRELTSDRITIRRDGTAKPEEKTNVPTTISPAGGVLSAPTSSEVEFGSARKAKEKRVKQPEVVSAKPELDKKNEVEDKTLKGGGFSEESARGQKYPQTESELYNAGLEEQKRGRYDSAIKNYTDQLERFPKGRLSASAQYQINISKTEITKTSKDTASLRERKKMWERYIKEYPNSEYAQDARFELANISSEIAQRTNKKEDFDDAMFWNNEFLRQEKVTSRRARAEENLRDLKKTSKTR